MAITTMGIDPGQTGAAALLVDGQFADVIDFTDGPVVVARIEAWLDLHTVNLAVLESVGAMPRQGVSSTFKFGANFGWWRGVLDTLAIPYREIRPQIWMKGLVPPKNMAENKPSLPVARRLFPSASLHLQKHNGRSDALLMAFFAYNQLK